MSEQINNAMQQLPLNGWGLIALLLVGGLVLWTTGRRLLRGGFALTGLLVGVLGGYVVARWMALTPQASLIPAIVAGLVAAGLAMLAYRLAVAGGLATVLAVATPVAVWSVVLAAPDQETAQGILASPEIDEEPAADEESDDLLDDLDQWLEGLSDAEDDDVVGPPLSAIPLDRIRDAVAEDIDKAADSLPEPLRQVADRTMEAWQAIPPVWQQRLLGAAALGAAGGFVLGMLASSLSASLVTAGAGAMTWMVASWVTLVRTGCADSAWLPTTPHGWLIAWIAISIIGLAIQWTIRPRRADKAA